MATKKISELDAKTSLAGTEELLINDGGTSKKTTAANLVASSLDGAVVINESGADVDFRIESDTRPNAFFLDGATGNIGLGRNDTDARLEIADTTNPILRLFSTIVATGDGTTVGEIQFEQNDVSGAGVFGKITAINESNVTPACSMAFHTGRAVTLAERMRIDSSGRVGIGTSSPTFLADIQKSSEGNILRLKGSTNNRYLDFTTFTVGTVNGAGFKINATSSDGTIAFATAGTERMRLDSSGRLLVGTTTQSGKVTVYNGGNNTGISIFQTSTVVNYLPLLIHNDRIFAGNTVPMVVFAAADGADVGSIDSNTTGTAYNTTSDQRLKENIVDAPSASDDIDAIQVRSFDWKVNGSHQKYGMVAQELQSVAPIAVTGDADSDNMMGVDYSKLVPMLIKEVQSLRNRVATLEGN